MGSFAESSVRRVIRQTDELKYAFIHTIVPPASSKGIPTGPAGEIHFHHSKRFLCSFVPTKEPKTLG